MERIAPTPVGTKKSQGRDFKIPTEGRIAPKGGTRCFHSWKILLSDKIKDSSFAEKLLSDSNNNKTSAGDEVADRLRSDES